MDASPDTGPDPGTRLPPLAPAGARSDRDCDQLLDVRPPLDITGTADGHTAARARREFTIWLARDLAAGALLDDLVLAVYEALANAADHAYTPTSAGLVRLLAHRSRDAVHITVSDRGTWREEPATESFRGRGLSLIRLLVRHVHIESGPTGTTMHLSTPLPPAGGSG